MRSVVIATRSEGKIAELVPLLAARGIAAQSLGSRGVHETVDEDALEQFTSFEANALAKARHFAARLPGEYVIADDSGVVVDALGGRPGVASKRWSARPGLVGSALDAANNDRLQQELRDAGALTIDARSARYVCAMAYCRAGQALSEGVAIGRVEGRIVSTPHGANGFGYDPWFWSTELGKRFGDATREEKASVSHRARALVNLLDHLLAAAGD